MPARFLTGQVGGNTTYARALADGLSARGHEVKTFGDSANAALARTAEALAPFRSSFDIVHYVGDTGGVVPGRVPSVVTVHGVASRWIRTARTVRQEAIWRARVRASIAASAHVVTVSNSSASDICEVFNIPEEKVSVIYHGVEQAALVKSAGPTSLPEFLKNGPPFVLYLGNIEPRKNLVTLMDAWRRLGPRGRDGHVLIVAGRTAWNYQDSMRAIQSTPDTHFLGFVSDATRAALLQNARLFVFPSLYEGFGFPVLEALSAGCRVICTNVGSLAEVAGPAMRFDGTDVEAVAEGLQRGLSAPAPSPPEVAEARAWVSRFSWARSVESHLGLYSKAHK